MKIDVKIAPDIVAMMATEVAAGQKAVSDTMTQAGAGLKSAWRTQITGAGLGQRLANTIRQQVYPKGRNSLDAAALVWSNAPVIIGAHADGVLIRPNKGLWLAIPLPAAGKKAGGFRITPKEWEQRRGVKLRFVRRKGRTPLLVAETRLLKSGIAVESRSKTGRGLATVPIFLMVPQVKLPKRLDLARDAERAQAAIPGSIVRNWVEDHL